MFVCNVKEAENQQLSQISVGAKDIGDIKNTNQNTTQKNSTTQYMLQNSQRCLHKYSTTIGLLNACENKTNKVLKYGGVYQSL